MSDLQARAKRIALLKAQKDYLEAMVKWINIEINAIGPKLYEDFIEDEMENITLSADLFPVDKKPRVVKPFVDLKVNVTEDHREEFHAWLRENGFGQLIKETVHPGTLTSFVKERKESNQPIPQCVSIWSIQGAKITKGR